MLGEGERTMGGAGAGNNGQSVLTHQQKGEVNRRERERERERDRERERERVRK